MARKLVRYDFFKVWTPAPPQPPPIWGLNNLVKNQKNQTRSKLEISFGFLDKKIQTFSKLAEIARKLVRNWSNEKIKVFPNWTK